jgi:hypothetical protein
MNHHLHYLVLPALCSAFAHNCLGDTMPISITNEIVIAQGEAMHPTSVSATADGHLIVTGSWPGAKTGMAAKLDKDGHVQWTYRARQDSPAKQLRAPAIADAALLATGEVLLCANETRAAEEPGAIQGSLVKLSAKGDVIERTTMAPKAVPDFRLSRIDKCGRWGDGAYAIGVGRRLLPYAGDADKPHKNRLEFLLWIIKTNAQGKVEWEQLIPTQTYLYDVSRPQVLPNGELVLSAYGNAAHPDKEHFQSTEIAVVSPQGKINARRYLPGHNILVRRTAPALPIVLMREASLGVRGIGLLYLDGALATVKEQRIADPGVGGRLAFLRPQGDLVLIGTTAENGPPERGIARIDLAHDKRERLLLPAPANDRYDINEATPLTEGSGSFAFINQRYDTSIPGNHFALGVTLVAVD